MTVLSMLLLGLMGAEQPIDVFRYAEVEAAQRAWVANEDTPPVELADANGSPGIRVIAPFGAEPGLSRTVIDRRVELDLAAPGQFALEVACPTPEALSQVTLYFRSGDGWYGSGSTLAKQGWQTLLFSKASFRTEGNPTGWHKIDGVRIAAWRAQAKDGSLTIRRLAALSHEVALVIPAKSPRSNDGELQTAMQTADRLGAMLEELGLGADAVDEPAVVRGGLGDRRVAVLAYNPRLGDPAIAALEQFVEGGGKLLVCYQLPPRLGALLGFGRQEYVRARRSGELAEIRFDAADVAGLPESVRQASWNITVAEPTGHNARVIGRWYDDAGKATGRAAMLLSDRGAFFTHIVLADDRAGKRQMLAAVLGHLAPGLWQQMARSALDRAAGVGHCGDIREAEAYVKAHGDAEALELLRAAIETRDRAEKRLGEGACAEAVELARTCRELLSQTYLRAQPSPTREGRAVWNHSGTGAYPGDWDRSAKELAAAGFNMVLPNMLWGGVAHYPSDVLPRSGTYRKYGDQIQQCVAAAKRHALEVHVWKVNYNLSGAPKEFVEKLRGEGRLQVSADGRQHNWLCPSHPQNKQLELESMLEVARKYPVDGLHFDYIRYPGRQHCFCDGCRRRFEAETGREVLQWPKDCYSGPLREPYVDWRCQQIHWLVEAVHREAKKIRPELKISAAVFGGYPGCRESVLQDWPVWVRSGWLDFICPMDYTQSDLYFQSLVKNQLKLVDGRIPVYAGIGAWRLTADRAVGQIHWARELGAAGFTLFNLDGNAAKTLIPNVRLGAGKEAAAVPHGSR